MRNTCARVVLAACAACADPSSPSSTAACTAKCDAFGSNVQRFKFTGSGRYLIVELLRDDLAHFELSAVGQGPDVGVPIWTSPMVAKHDYPGPTQVTQSGSTLETPELRIEIEPSSLCITTTDKLRGFRLTRQCPLDLDHDWKGVTLTPLSHSAS